MSEAAVILVEDDAALREATAQALALEGFAVRQFEAAEPALRQFDPEFAGVVVTDVRLPGADGLELFARLREQDDEAQVIFTTGHGDVAMAVEAMRRGAADFFTKPFATGELVRAVRGAAQRRALVIENRKLRAALGERGRLRLIGSSKHAERLRRTIAEVAQAEVDVVITGAPGAGKTFAAQLVHELSPRKGRPLMVADAGILTHDDAELLLFGRDPAAGLSRSGLIERAQGGTLLLDGLELASDQLRARLLSVIANRSYLSIGGERPRPADIRAITIARSAGGAPNQAADALLHRLGGIAIAMPPLVERREDIPELFRHFVREYEAQAGVTAADIGEPEWRRLMRHDWPGNLRELSTFARNFVLGLTRIDQPAGAPAGSSSLREMMQAFEHAVLSEALRDAGGQVAKARRALGVPRKTLYDKLAKHGLKAADFRK